MFSPLLLLLLLFCFSPASTLTNGREQLEEEEDQHGFWKELADDGPWPDFVVDSSVGNKAHANNDINRNRRLFKSTAQLDAETTPPSESWPTDFYRLMTVCRRNATGSEGQEQAMLYMKEGRFECPHNGTVALGRYQNYQNSTGWGILEVETFPGFPLDMQAYAAGLVEGSLTKVQIFYHYKNTVADMCKKASAKNYCRELSDYLAQNLEWIEQMTKTAPPSDLYWRQVNLTFAQLTGLYDGYSAEKAAGYAVQTKFRLTPIYMIQLFGELYDLKHVFPRNESAASKKKKHLRPEPGHCSALIKVTPDNQDILMSHNTWAGYNAMNRILKLYKFAYDRKEVPGFAVSFSGYPAGLASGDDFTLSSSGMLTMETTIDIFNDTLYQRFVQPQDQLHCWLRSYISNQLASSGRQWVEVFARHNSGTYNNQWMMLDYKLFKPGQQELPSADLFWILEQIPGTTQSRDLTWFLRRYGYWPSYNIPYLNTVSELSGYRQQANANNWWRWGHSPRARIFQRNHTQVRDMQTLKTLMRYNDFKHDELSRCKCQPVPYTAQAAIASRGDLNPVNGTWEVPEMGDRHYGAYDYKGTNYELFSKLRFEVIGGPTFGGVGQLPHFSWANTTALDDLPHWGQPQDWKFDPFVTLWQTPELDVKMDG